MSGKSYFVLYKQCLSVMKLLIIHVSEYKLEAYFLKCQEILKHRSRSFEY